MIEIKTKNARNAGHWALITMWMLSKQNSENYKFTAERLSYEIFEMWNEKLYSTSTIRKGLKEYCQSGMIGIEDIFMTPDSNNRWSSCKPSSVRYYTIVRHKLFNLLINLDLIDDKAEIISELSRDILNLERKMSELRKKFCRLL